MSDSFDNERFFDNPYTDFVVDGLAELDSCHPEHDKLNCTLCSDHSHYPSTDETRSIVGSLRFYAGYIARRCTRGRLSKRTLLHLCMLLAALLLMFLLVYLATALNTVHLC